MTPELKQRLIEMRDALQAQIDWIDEQVGVGETDLFGNAAKPLPATTRTAKKSTKMRGPMPPGLGRIRAVFGHKITTMPTMHERGVYDDLASRLGKEKLYEDIDTIERFYPYSEKKAHDEPDLWPHDSETLMNNWDKVIARASAFLKSRTRPEEEKERPGIPEPSAWRQWANDNWDKKGWEYWESVSWKSLPSDVQLEIHKNCR
jgi:hypothetical protein